MTINTPDNHFDSILISAVRYCIGRRTYMPSIVTGWIMGHCKGQLEHKTVNVMIRDIEEVAQRGEEHLGDECDRETWMEFLEWLKKEAAE